MKTMRNGDSVIRVKEKEVDAKLAAGYKYCPKKAWKDINSTAKREKKDNAAGEQDGK